MDAIRYNDKYVKTPLGVAFAAPIALVGHGYRHCRSNEEDDREECWSEQ